MNRLKKGLIVWIAMALFSFSGFAAENEYKIDKAHSTIGFNVRHLGLSKVHGQFKTYNAKVVWDESTLNNSSIYARFDVDSIDTGIKKRDKHLKSDDFFDAKEHPYITFKSTRLIREDDDEYVLYGQLTIKGNTKAIKIPLEVVGRGKGPRGKERIGLEGSAKIDRFDYDLNWKSKLKNGRLIVARNVKIELDLQLIKQ